MRLVIPALATPVGGLIAGYTMTRYGKLAWLVRVGTFAMTVGNLAVACLSFSNAHWKYFVFLFPANLGIGMANPSMLFSFIGMFEHQGKIPGNKCVYPSNRS
jgi:MFS family permease